LTATAVYGEQDPVLRGGPAATWPLTSSGITCRPGSLRWMLPCRPVARQRIGGADGWQEAGTGAATPGQSTRRRAQPASSAGSALSAATGPSPASALPPPRRPQHRSQDTRGARPARWPPASPPCARGRLPKTILIRRRPPPLRPPTRRPDRGRFLNRNEFRPHLINPRTECVAERLNAIAQPTDLSATATKLPRLAVGNRCRNSPIVAMHRGHSARRGASSSSTLWHWVRMKHPPLAIEWARVFARSPLSPTPAPTVAVALGGSRSLHLAGCRSPI